MKSRILMQVLLASVSAFAAEEVIAKCDSRKAIEKTVVDANGVKWIDGKCLPLEGRAFTDVEHYYDRLPAGVTTNVNAGVRELKHHTAGMIFRFLSDSKTLKFRWKLYIPNQGMDNQPSTGVNGIDVYRYDKKSRRWLYVKTGRIFDAAKGGSLDIEWVPGTPCLVNLPAYNGIRTFELGIDQDATVKPLAPRATGIDKPVVFYGTSITQGGCSSRPGLGFVNIVGRSLDVPVVNLGFSGSGIMEFEMSEHLARIDASCYVLDCLANMELCENPQRPGRSVTGNYEKFIRNLRAKRPSVPIVMAENSNVYGNVKNGKDLFIRKLYEKLVAEGWQNLVYLPNDEMHTGDYEGTVDGSHPNDWGMMSMARAFGKAVRKALKLKGPAPLID